MKVLLDIDESKFINLFATNKLPGKLLGTEKNMTMNSMFNELDIWQQSLDLLDKHELAKIDEFDVRQDFIEDVIKQLNKDFDANEGVSWVTVNNAILDTYDKYATKFAEFGEEISLDGLRQALERYDESGKEGLCFLWDIHRGAYDKWWEASYNGRAVFGCYASGKRGNSGVGEYGNLERDTGGIPDKTFKEICDIVHSVFPECRMAPEEQSKIQESSQILGR